MMERSDFENSTKKAQRYLTRSRVSGLVTKDFMWATGRWRWWPERFTQAVFLWNPEGGAALNGVHRRTYWLCMGWSRIEVRPDVDHVDTIQNGGRSKYRVDGSINPRKEGCDGGA